MVDSNDCSRTAPQLSEGAVAYLGESCMLGALGIAACHTHGTASRVVLEVRDVDLELGVVIGPRHAMTHGLHGHVVTEAVRRGVSSVLTCDVECAGVEVVHRGALVGLGEHGRELLGRRERVATGLRRDVHELLAGELVTEASFFHPISPRRDEHGARHGVDDLTLVVAREDVLGVRSECHGRFSPFARAPAGRVGYDALLFLSQ